MPLKIDTDTINRIINELKNLETEYQTHKALILTESDLKCHLFSRIHALFPDGTKTIDSHITGTALHSEVKFFDEHDELTLVPDLTVISPENISIYHSVEFGITSKGIKYKGFSRKNFEIGGDAIIIELKFCREQIGITTADLQTYKADLDKIRRLQDIVWNRSAGHDKLIGIFAVFNKGNKGKELFNDFMQTYNPTWESENNFEIRSFYGSGLVDFTDPNRYITTEGFVTKRKASQ